MEALDVPLAGALLLDGQTFDAYSLTSACPRPAKLTEGNILGAQVPPMRRAWHLVPE